VTSRAKRRTLIELSVNSPYIQGGWYQVERSQSKERRKKRKQTALIINGSSLRDQNAASTPPMLQLAIVKGGKLWRKDDLPPETGSKEVGEGRVNTHSRRGVDQL